jgi:hypothetical protein
MGFLARCCLVSHIATLTFVQVAISPAPTAGQDTRSRLVTGASAPSAKSPCASAAASPRPPSGGDHGAATCPFPEIRPHLHGSLV